MKKICLFLLLMMLMLSGCGKTEGPTIEQSSWQLSTAQNEEGALIACGVNNETCPDDTPAVDLLCTAENGVLTLENAATGRRFSGSYRLDQSKGVTVIYEITLEEQPGFAVVSTTEYEDGSSVPTLILRVSDCTMSFFSCP